MASRVHGACLAKLSETEQASGFSEDDDDEPLLVEEEFDQSGAVAAQEDPSFTPTEDGYGDWASRRSEWKPFDGGRDLSSWKTDDGFEDQPFARIGLAVQLAAAAAGVSGTPTPLPPIAPPPQPGAPPAISAGFLQRWVGMPCVLPVLGAGGAPPQPISPAGLPLPGCTGTMSFEASERGKAVHEPGVRSQSTTPPVSARTSGSHDSSTKDEAAREDGVPRTTVMLRNIPNDYNRELLCELLDEEGFAAAYDFVYLPMDFKRKAGLGYAFINLIDVPTAERFLNHFEGFRKWRFDSKKVCQTAWGEPLRSLAQHIERHRNSPLMHEDVPDEFKPVVFRDGVRVEFPAPTKRVRPPRVKFS